MAQPFVSGAAHLAYFFPAGSSSTFANTLQYVGTAERSPRIQTRKGWIPLFNDLGGPSIPFDMCYEGEESFISADLTRWTEAVYSAMTAIPTNTVRGFNGVGDIGTLMMTEGVAGTLFVLFPYTTLKPLTYGTQPAGYRFVRAWLEGPDDLDPLGTQPRKIRLVWRALRGFQLTSDGPTFSLYDHNMGAFNAGIIN